MLSSNPGAEYTYTMTKLDLIKSKMNITTSEATDFISYSCDEDDNKYGYSEESLKVFGLPVFATEFIIFVAFGSILFWAYGMRNK